MITAVELSALNLAGVAKATSGSGVAKVALSRASSTADSTTSSSREPAHANPSRAPSEPFATSTRTPMPPVVADESDSTSPSYARTSMSCPRTT